MALRALVLLIALGVLGACDSGGANSSDGGGANSPGGDTDSEFNVDIRFSGKNGGFTSDEKTDIRNAVNLWQKAITSGLTTADLPDTGDECTYDKEEVEDVALVMSKTDVDDSQEEGNALAKGGTCAVRPSDNTTALGSIELDKEDLPLDSPVRTVAHEFGHVLGIGTSWKAAGLIDSENSRYEGKNASDAYEELGGETGGVPLDKNNSHWSDSDFGRELMTRTNQPSSAPLSKVSLAVLEDLGYSVDLSKAESYSVP